MGSGRGGDGCADRPVEAAAERVVLGEHSVASIHQAPTRD